MWLSEWDRILVARFASAGSMVSSDPLLLSRRGLCVRVVGVGLVGFVMAGHHDRRAHRAHVTHAVGERKSLLSHTLSTWFALPTAPSTGRECHQDYVVCLRAENGWIIFFREYLDAPRVVAAFSKASVRNSS